MLDPRPDLVGLACPVHLVHGMDDNVIPHTQLPMLRDAMPAHVEVATYLTGMFGHTGRAGLLALTDLARELWTMVRMLGALVRAGSARPPSPLDL